MKRVVWFSAGVAAGAGGTVWAQRRVKELVRTQLDRTRPAHVVGVAADAGRRIGVVVRDAVAEGRATARAREVELRGRLGPEPPRPPLRAVGAPEPRR